MLKSRFGTQFVFHELWKTPQRSSVGSTSDERFFVIIEKSLSLPIRPDIQARIVPKLSLQAQGWAAEGVFVRQGHQKYAKTKLPQFENARVRQVLAPDVYLETSESFKILRTLLF